VASLESGDRLGGGRGEDLGAESGMGVGAGEGVDCGEGTGEGEIERSAVFTTQSSGFLGRKGGGAGVALGIAAEGTLEPEDVTAGRCRVTVVLGIPLRIS